MKLGKSPRWGQRYPLKQAQYFETSPARLIQLSLTSGQIVWWAGVKGSPASGGFTMPEFKSEWERYPHFCWHFSQDLRESQKSKCITFYFQNDPNQHSPIPSHSWQCCLSETSGHLSPSEEKNSIDSGNINFWILANGHRYLPDILLIQFFCFRSQQRGASTKNEVIRERDCLVFFPLPTSKLIQMPVWTVGGKSTCEIEANPNSNIVLLDLWQRNSR